jgi:hypothetical protein
MKGDFIHGSVEDAAGRSSWRRLRHGLEAGQEDIFPDPASAGIADGWRGGIAKALEREFGAFVPAPATVS